MLPGQGYCIPQEPVKSIGIEPEAHGEKPEYELWHDCSLQHMVLNHVPHPENDLWNKSSIKSHVFYNFVDRTLPMETAQAIKACRLKGGKLHSFLTSTLDECEWSTYGLSRFAPGEKPQAPIKWEVRLPLGCSGCFGGEQITSPHWNLNPGSSSP